jgi:large subunit ribosomal protein L1
MDIKSSIIKALEELRKNEKRKFTQTVELIVNLKGFDPKRESVNTFAEVPNKVKDRKVGAFLTKKSAIVDSILKSEFDKYKDKKEIKKLSKKYDFFIGFAGVMPAVATTFGRILGPLGKMPSPQVGIIMKEEDEEIKKIVSKIDKLVKIRAKEASIKMPIAKEDMSDDKIIENAVVVYNKVIESLPKKKEQVKSVMIKFTMTKPIKLDIK